MIDCVVNEEEVLINFTSRAMITFNSPRQHKKRVDNADRLHQQRGGQWNCRERFAVRAVGFFEILIFERQEPRRVFVNLAVTIAWNEFFAEADFVILERVFFRRVHANSDVFFVAVAWRCALGSKKLRKQLTEAVC